MLVEGSRNYPTQFRNYENFTTFRLIGATGVVGANVADRPVCRLAGRSPLTDSYVLITRSRRSKSIPVPMPAGSLSQSKAPCGAHLVHVALDTGDATVSSCVSGSHNSEGVGASSEIPFYPFARAD